MCILRGEKKKNREGEQGRKALLGFPGKEQDKKDRTSEVKRRVAGQEKPTCNPGEEK